MAYLVLFACVVIASTALGYEGFPRDGDGPTMIEMAKQLQMHQFHVEELVRSDGDSGIKQLRHRTQGTRNYYGETHGGSIVGGMHNHADFERHTGSGEFEAVLNGVQFKTRHNDYQLHMPSRRSSGFLQVDNVPFPPVPPAVLRKRNVRDQIVEMRQWFKAWQNGDTSKRDYRPYFRPVLCYLEGAWTTQTGKLVEPFKSDRHFFDADTWAEMHSKIRYTSETGTKGRMENFGYCPTKIYDTSGGCVKVAQWIYRIMCHPLKSDVPLDRLSPIDELANRVPYRRDPDDLDKYSSTRYRLNVYNTTSDKQGFIKWQFIDDLMAEIPGLNNYKGRFELDDSLGITAHEYRRGDKPGQKVLDTSYYHRLSSDKLPDAMDNFFKTRGFSDENLFMAKTCQKQVVPTTTRHCPLVNGKRQSCKVYTQRWSYAIPLEIIYLNPLSRWNPYNIIYRGDANSPNGKKVTANGRDGLVNSKSRAYDGVNTGVYAITPSNFQTGGEINPDPADTSTRSTVYVLSEHGRVHKVRYSGVRIFMPKIPGIGVLRLRYPIMPVYADGNPIMKELQAMRDLLENHIG